MNDLCIHLVIFHTHLSKVFGMTSLGKEPGTSNTETWNLPHRNMEPPTPRHGTSHTETWNLPHRDMEPPTPRHGTSHTESWNLQHRDMEPPTPRQMIYHYTIEAVFFSNLLHIQNIYTRWLWKYLMQNKRLYVGTGVKAHKPYISQELFTSQAYHIR